MLLTIAETWLCRRLSSVSESSPFRFSTTVRRFLARFNTLSSLKWPMFSILAICQRYEKHAHCVLYGYKINMYVWHTCFLKAYMNYQFHTIVCLCFSKPWYSEVQNKHSPTFFLPSCSKTQSTFPSIPSEIRLLQLCCSVAATSKT